MDFTKLQAWEQNKLGALTEEETAEIVELLCVLKAATHNTTPSKYTKGKIKFSFFSFPKFTNPTWGP
jgi:hypothetical protein